MGKLESKTILITGGARGIGLCTARECQRLGAIVILADRDIEALKEAQFELGEVDIHVVDITDRQTVDEMAEAILSKYGSLDILVNNAGIGFHGSMAETETTDWQKLLSVNLVGTLNVTYAFLPSMRTEGNGIIVNVSSGQAFIRMPTWGAYAAVKAALGVFSEVLYFEERKNGIHVATVYPFMVNTGFYEDVEGDSWGHRLSMKALPLYSMSPETVAKRIVRVIRDRQRIDLTHPINAFYWYGRLVPGFTQVTSTLSHLFLK